MDNPSTGRGFLPGDNTEYERRRRRHEFRKRIARALGVRARIYTEQRVRRYLDETTERYLASKPLEHFWGLIGDSLYYITCSVVIGLANLSFAALQLQAEVCSYLPGLARALLNKAMPLTDVCPNINYGFYQMTGRPSDVIDSLLLAISGQESGGDPTVRNRSGSGAMGEFQIMPGTLAMYRPDISEAEFMASPELQREVATEMLTGYWQDAMNAGFAGCEAVRFVASTWYSGNGHLMNSTAPQYWAGDPYPSIADYTHSVAKKTGCASWGFDVGGFERPDFETQNLSPESPSL